MAASSTLIEMPTQGRSPAVGDGAQHTEMLRCQPAPMGLDEACPELANDIGHLEGWPRHRLWSRRERCAVSGVDTAIVSRGLATACRCRRDRCR
jgi:hypothetical protein